MKRILAPTDFSKDAFNAIEYVLQLLKGEEIKLYLLHVYDLPLNGSESFATSVQTMIGEQQTEAQEKIDLLVKSIKQLYPKVKCHILLHYINMIDACTEAASKYNIDWIVMGTQGASGIKKLLGSNTAAVITHTNHPLLAVPSKAKYRPIKKIVFATDYNEQSINSELVTEIALASGAEVMVFHVHRKTPLIPTFQQQKAGLELAGKMSIVNHSYHFEEDDDVPESIMEFSKEKGADLLVLFPQKKNILEKILKPAVTRSIAHSSELPVLVIPATEKKNDNLI